jgi:hypothetical protein
MGEALRQLFVPDLPIVILKEAAVWNAMPEPQFVHFYEILRKKFGKSEQNGPKGNNQLDRSRGKLESCKALNQIH